MAKEKPIGKVIHFFDKIKVAVIKFSKEIKEGRIVRFKGTHTDFSQELDSMQIDHKAVKTVKKGQEAGIMVSEKVREGDEVYEAE
jgi:hypothetical protein